MVKRAVFISFALLGLVGSAQLDVPVNANPQAPANGLGGQVNGPKQPQQQTNSPQVPILGDMLNNLMPGSGPNQPQQQQMNSPQVPILGDIMNNLLPGSGPNQPQQQQMNSPQVPILGDMMNNLLPGSGPKQSQQPQQQQQQQSQQPQQRQQPQAGGLTDLIFSIPQRGIQALQNIMSGMRNLLPGGRDNRGQQSPQGRLPLMGQQSTDGSNSPLNMANAQSGQQPQGGRLPDSSSLTNSSPQQSGQAAQNGIANI